MEELINDYLEELYNKPEFKRLIELKEIIDVKYKKEIISLKTNESAYIDASKYGNHYPNLEELKNNYNNSKVNLYSKPEVKEYLELDLMFNELLDNDLNDIKKSISNKFKLSTSFFKN